MRGVHSKFTNSIQEKFLDALQRRVDRDPHGELVLPTGIADAGEVGRVLAAIDCARDDGRRRCRPCAAKFFGTRKKSEVTGNPQTGLKSLQPQRVSAHPELARSA
jgi:hypothetical protein